MRIKKISGTAVLNGNIIDSLDDNSTTNAPSQRVVNEAINDVKGTILWTNPNPTSDFAEQDVTLTESIENYDEYIVLAKTWKGNPTLALSTRVPITFGVPMMYQENGIFYQRYTTKPSGKTLHIASCNDNAFVTPIYVIGYKTGLFS